MGLLPLGRRQSRAWAIFFDAQLYANELADAVERGEKTNNTNAVKLDSEMKRRAKGTPRLTNEELQALQPQDLMEIHSEIPEMGTVCSVK